MDNADANQLESAILKLDVNARDAMPDGGKLTIGTANTFLDERYVENAAEVVPGQYVVISVADSGAGISKDGVGSSLSISPRQRDGARALGLALSTGSAIRRSRHVL